VKKLLTYLLRATAIYIVVVLAFSCQKDDAYEQFVDQTAEVSFSTSIDEVTRAWEGENVDKLYVEVYLESTLVQRAEFEAVNGVIEHFSLSLLKGQRYTAVFWAQDKDCTVYDNTDLKAIGINYSKGTDFDKVRAMDAFTAHCSFTVYNRTLNDGVSVQLRRPFALIFVGTNASNVNKTTTSSITVSNVATTFNAATGNGVENNSIASFINLTPDDSVVPGTSQKMVAMAYVLPVKNKTSDITISTTTDSNTVQNTIRGVKLEANKKYNILSSN
jgi:hypothetical protein